MNFNENGVFDQMTSVVVATPPPSGNVEVHFTSTTPLQLPSGAVFEAFHYPVPPTGQTSITKAFYSAFADNYDFLVIFTDSHFDAQEAAPAGFGAVQPIPGIFENPGSNGAAAFGSAGRLQSGVNPSWIMAPLYDQENPNVPFSNWGWSMFLLSHELGHRWLADLDFTDANGRQTLHDSAPHWLPNVHAPSAFPQSQLAETSPMGGENWTDNGNGTFSTQYPPYFYPSGYSYLDLYAMGLMSPSEIPPFFVINNMSSGTYVNGTTTVSGTKEPVTISQVISAMGPRPPVGSLPVDFNIGWILLVQSGNSATAAELTRIAEVRQRFETHFQNITGGRGTMSSTLLSKQASPPARISVVSGDNQTGSAGAALANPLVFQVQDASGHPFPFATVLFSTSAGSLSALTGTTDQNGQTSVLLSLPSVAATAQVTARLSGGPAVKVTETATAGPLLTQAGILNAASFQGGSIAPGEIIVLYGSGFGPSSIIPTSFSSSGEAATNLGGTRVLFDGIAAPLVFAASGQVSAIIPYEVAGQAATSVQVEWQGVRSVGVSVPVAPAAPGIFTADSSGTGPGAILNQDQSLNSAINPAAQGSIVVLYCTGEGQTSPLGTDGLISSGTPPKPVLPVSVQFGGLDGQVIYAGGVSSVVAGLMQVNVRLPAGLPSGNVPVVVSVGGQPSQAGVSVVVQ